MHGVTPRSHIPQISHPEELVETPNDTCLSRLCDLIQRLCNAIILGLRYIFCCASSNAAPIEDSDTTNSLRGRSIEPIPPGGQPTPTTFRGRGSSPLPTPGTRTAADQREIDQSEEEALGFAPPARGDRSSGDWEYKSQELGGIRFQSSDLPPYNPAAQIDEEDTESDEEGYLDLRLSSSDPLSATNSAAEPAPLDPIPKADVVASNAPRVLPQLITEAVAPALHAIAHAYDSYLSNEAELMATIETLEGGFSMARLNIELRAVAQYTLNAFRAINVDMRNGDIPEELASAWKKTNMGDFGKPGNIGRRAFTALLQKTILDSDHPLARMLISRKAWCSKDLVEFCLQEFQAHKPIYLVNKSILSTTGIDFSPGAPIRINNFHPAQTALIPGTPDEIEKGETPNDLTHLEMRFRLLEKAAPEKTGILNTSLLNLGVASESEVMISAGRIFKVDDCRQKWGKNEYELSLVEVAPEDVPEDAIVCTNIL